MNIDAVTETELLGVRSNNAVETMVTPRPLFVLAIRKIILNDVAKSSAITRTSRSDPPLKVQEIQPVGELKTTRSPFCMY
ncbi:MAG: hypothetical protein JRN20_11110 [Nitrososphaerota archaeon]|nr:hypothetical protein [Nitrososphaerota archaeon]MDG6923827.1 hypothetical protein [Nitrososphaerota archaeon]